MSKDKLNQSLRYGKFPAGNRVANALMLIVGTLAVGAAIVLGFFAFIFLAGIILVLAGIVGIRVWWISRKLRKRHEAEGEAGAVGKGEAGIIEGEYRVVSTRRDRDRR
jgi:predicted lipid-binding transport protein (Tim44 family)